MSQSKFGNLILKIRNNKWKAVLFLFLFAAGIFLRSYNFSPWLHFEIDQSYDMLAVSPAVEHGFYNLPLLGPTAAGSRTLRLGPAYYYLEYVSALIFGNTPAGYAAIILVFSILAMPLSYLFFRRYFSIFISFCLLAVFSSSLYMVVYSRFAWNPNVLPFLTLLSFYALLKSVAPDEKRKENWLLVSMAAIAIATQAHYNAFFIIPPAVAVFLFLKKSHFEKRTWILAALIVGAVYSPMVLSDIKTGGQNMHFFMEQLQGNKGHGINSPSTLGETIVQTIQYTASEYFLIITGVDHINNDQRMLSFGFDSTINTPWRIAALVLLFLAVSLLLADIKKEKDTKRKDFLLLSALLFSFSILFFFFLQNGGGYITYSRFYLEISILPFIFLGLIMEKISIKRLGRAKTVLPGIFIVLIVSANLQGLTKYFYQLQNVDRQPLIISEEDVFPNTVRITIDQELKIVDYMESKVHQNGYPVYLSASNAYQQNFVYLLEKDGVNYFGPIEKTAVYAGANYFFIPYGKNSIDEYTGQFNVVENKNFGALNIFYLSPKPEAITFAQQYPVLNVITPQQMQVDEIPTWKTLLRP